MSGPLLIEDSSPHSGCQRPTPGLTGMSPESGHRGREAALVGPGGPAWLCLAWPTPPPASPCLTCGWAGDWLGWPSWFLTVMMLRRVTAKAA